MILTSEFFLYYQNFDCYLGNLGIPIDTWIDDLYDKIDI